MIFESSVKTDLFVGDDDLMRYVWQQLMRLMFVRIISPDLPNMETYYLTIMRLIILLSHQICLTWKVQSSPPAITEKS